MAVLGNNNIQSTSFDSHTFIYGQIFQATQNGTVTDINVYMSVLNPNQEDVTFGIYNSSSTTPSSWIASTAGGLITGSGSAWITRSLSASIVAGNFYALTTTNNAAGSGRTFYDTIASNSRYFQTPYTYVSGTLPLTFPTGTADNTALLSIYVNYTPSGTSSGNGSLTLMGIGKDFSFPTTLFGGLEALRKRKNKVRQWEKKGHIWRMAA
jgi:hypothetical protein